MLVFYCIAVEIALKDLIMIMSIIMMMIIIIIIQLLKTHYTKILSAFYYTKFVKVIIFRNCLKIFRDSIKAND